MKYITCLFVCLCVLSLVTVKSASARVGVGVGSGKITVTDLLKPGVIYELPPINVVNTGDEPSAYNLTVTYNEHQPELKPPIGWFQFSPDGFTLNPGEVKNVNIQLNLPFKADVGNYFAYLEARPQSSGSAGSSSVTIAAAAKLYFTVVPATLTGAVLAKLTSWWRIYSPWPQRLLTVISVLIILAFIKNTFKFQVSFKNKNG